ncbi:XRE family transcriptional regulator [Nocardioides sp. W7]|uniref:helix-turn-helix domain-containing protein n=1 Tax=Nocardioides sp. W7 TaxID=2931390 RepID=UPI001FD30B19|nr:XRE family transcriptional regulator [Nocardioides sp. W7]
MDRSIANLGQVIRRHRLAAGMNVKQLAQETGYSGAYISQVESGTTLPSLSALSTIAMTVGADLTQFFPVVSGPKVRVSRAGDLNKLRMSPNAAEEYTILSSHGPGTSLTALVHRAYPSEEPPVKFRNVGERFALVLSGSVQFTFNGETEDLGAGESVHFTSQTPYSMEITSNGPAEILWFVSPAIV